LNSVRIADIGGYEGQEVRIQGWLYNKRSSGKIYFLIVRDGSGFVQAVAVRGEILDDQYDLCGALTQESSIIVTGRVRADERAMGGFELTLTGLELVQVAEEYPITLKEHG